MYLYSIVFIYFPLFSGSTAPRYSMDVFSDIFLVLNKEYCDNLSRWLNTLLSQEGFPSPRISSQQKEAFVKSVLR